MDKRARLLELARKRQAARWSGYTCVGDYHAGGYECDLVSPYTKTAGNVDGHLFVMLQDWSSHDSLIGPFDRQRAEAGHTWHLPTNLTLTKLLKDTFDAELKDVYGTNLFPFVKPGSMSTPIRQGDLVRAAHEFGLPQVEIVRPKLVICLGVKTFNALRRERNLAICKNTASAIDSPFSFAGARMWCQAHTGTLGQNNRNKGGVERVPEDWEKMKADMDAHAGLGE